MPLKSKKDSKFLRYLIDELPLYVFWKDKNLIFRGCNKKFAQQFGYDNSDYIVGKTDADFPWLPHLRKKYINDDMQIISKGVAKLNYEEEQKQLNGSIRTVFVSKVPIYDENGEVNGILGIYSDITDRKKAEKLEQDKVLAEKKIYHLRELGSIIAHEVRTPLGGIALNCDLIEAAFTAVIEAILKKDPKFYEEKIADHFAKAIKCRVLIDNVIKRTSTTINLLLNNIKEEELDTKKFKQISIDNDIQNVLHTYPFVNDEKQKVHYTGEGNFKYWGDLNLTQLIITNLLKNALYHVILENKGEIYISLKSDQDKNYLIFYDTGPGIPEKLLPKIFDRFVTGRPGGTGLGLAFCKTVMQACGGDISCASKEEEFTEFKLIFPKIKNQNIV